MISSKLFQNELWVASCRLRVMWLGFLVSGVFFSFLLIGCGKPLPTIDDLDLTKWKDDKNGCSGFRSTVEEIIVKQKEKLLSLSETDIVQLLGKPDETELYKRNEKFYKYYFSNGPGCNSNTESKSITLRFNAVGLSKEAVVD